MFRDLSIMVQLFGGTYRETIAYAKELEVQWHAGHAPMTDGSVLLQKITDAQWSGGNLHPNIYSLGESWALREFSYSAVLWANF